MYRVGIIGAGLIGNKRAKALRPQDKLQAVADVVPQRAKELASSYGADVETHWESLVERNDIDVVVIATSNNAIPICAAAALKNKKHILIEKPGGRNPQELKDLCDLAKQTQCTAKVGFNHRFHPAMLKAKAMIEEGAVGELMYFRARYGHGGRIGYDQEWRANPEISGGGELLDQGVHLIDLCRWMGGEFDLEVGRVHTFFWNMPVEDNGFLLLKSPDQKRYAHLHASCTEWKNIFDFEVFGKKGKLQIWGLGRSYGTEELRYYRVKPEMGVPEFTSYNFPEEDQSWNLEWKSFVDSIEGKEAEISNLEDGFKALEIVYQAYNQSRI
ncbi:MAG: gfo/Idh/MocA family oxidoreductase [Proteobacteria bacterium]|nr:gfo/Idh/MocA family oxidoreductase [Pseudomonadota bacterium]